MADELGNKLAARGGGRVSMRQGVACQLAGWWGDRERVGGGKSEG